MEFVYLTNINHDVLETLVTIEQLAQGFCYKNRTAMLTAFDDEAFTQHMDRIIVFSREEIGFVLKCGITLRERM